MNERPLLYFFGFALLAFLGSDIIRAEIFTGFEVFPRQALPDSENLISIENSGPLQADNVVVIIAANSTVSNFLDVCAEGEMDWLDDETLVAEFSRMTPNTRCEFGLEVSEPALLNVTITADGRLGPWSGEPSILYFYGIMAAILVIPAVEVLWLYFLTRGAIRKYWYKGGVWLTGDKFEKSMHAEKTIKFVKDWYYVRIGDTDATILEKIYCKNKTIRQLRNVTKLSKRQINYRIRMLQKKELLLDGTMDLEEALISHFKTILGQGTK